MSSYSPKAAKDEILDKLVYIPEQIGKRMIKVAETPIISTFRRASDHVGTSGALDSLPVEVLYMIMISLDIQTLSRLRKTCIRGHEVVESFPELRFLTRHIPTTLIALAKTRLLRYHTVSTLYAASITQACVSCQESFGSFMFLPSAERCCYECLYSNQAFWVISVSAAKRYFFNVNNRMLKQIPIMLSIPGEYSIGGFRLSNRRSLRVVSVKAVKQLALDHGISKEELLENADTDRAIAPRNTALARWLIEAPLEPMGRFPMIPPWGTGLRPIDAFGGMASFPFPSVSPRNIVNRGLWCRGCEETFSLYFRSELQWHDISHIVKSHDRYILRNLQVLKNFVRSEDAFLEHLSKCPGAKKLLPGLPELLQSASKI